MQQTPQQTALWHEIMCLNDNMFNDTEKQEFRRFSHGFREVFSINDERAAAGMWSKASDYMIRYADYQRQAITLAKKIRKDNA